MEKESHDEDAPVRPRRRQRQQLNEPGEPLRDSLQLGLKSGSGTEFISFETRFWGIDCLSSVSNQIFGSFLFAVVANNVMFWRGSDATGKNGNRAGSTVYQGTLKTSDISLAF